MCTMKQCFGYKTRSDDFPYLHVASNFCAPDLQYTTHHNIYMQAHSYCVPSFIGGTLEIPQLQYADEDQHEHTIVQSIQCVYIDTLEATWFVSCPLDTLNPVAFSCGIIPNTWNK